MPHKLPAVQAGFLYSSAVNWQCCVEATSSLPHGAPTRLLGSAPSLHLHLSFRTHSPSGPLHPRLPLSIPSNPVPPQPSILKRDPECSSFSPLSPSDGLPPGDEELHHHIRIPAPYCQRGIFVCIS